MTVTLTHGQLRALSITERVNACLSLVGMLFVIVTYIFSRSFNKPINRLIFFASFGNMGSSIASLISEAGPLAGNAAPLCKFQAFLVQMFLGVDCYWAFCMALNVYLVFFRDCTTDQLRSLDIRYLLACYGLSFIPAFVFIFISTPEGPIYGNAVIWCWITAGNGWMRIVFLYGIVWLAILFAFIVYAMAGKEIWNKRRHLEGFLNPFNEKPFASTVVTEIAITHEDRQVVKDDVPQNNDGDPYFVDIYTTQTQENHPIPTPMRIRKLTREVAESETNPEAWLYARVAFLFFIALLVTWVPSSVNRLYALARPNKLNFPLEYTASFVFPLQGFWNTIVYIITSQTACRKLWAQLRGRRTDYDYDLRKPSGTSFMSSWTGRSGQQRLPSLN